MIIIKNNKTYNVEYNEGVTYNKQVKYTEPPIPTAEYFYIEDISGAANTLSIVKYNADAPTIEVFKSSDMNTWESMGNTDTTPITATVPANGKLYLKAVTNRWTGTSYARRNQISCSGNYNVGGHIMSLLYGDNFENATFTNSNQWAFQRLFIGNTTLINAEDLILPSNTIDYCYSRMFESCENLATVPVLPAMVMTQSCYEGMFQYVHTSFTPPALPATTLANGCYGLMFWSSYITTAPALPATTLAESCYSSMFRYCSRLTTAPVLPATTLADSCYKEMFRNTGVKTVTTYANYISANNCLSNWLSSVPATGDFYNLGGATYESGASGIPSGWTEHHLLPEYFYVEDISGSDNTLSIRKASGSLPTIEVFYSTDKQNWTSMGNTDTTAITTTIPANSKLYLKAVTGQWSNDRDWGTYITASGNYNIGGNLNSLILGDNYYGGVMGNYSDIFSCLFKNSNTLISAANLELSGVMQTRCYCRLFQECRNLTTAPALPATTLAYQCYYHMFDTCTSLTTAPTLSATTLSGWCYKGMFQNCSALTTAPALPATTLTTYCYCEMFNNCTSLNSVTTYANDISANACLTGWLNNVAATGDFYNLGGATYESGASGIPSGWTEHTSL